MSLSGGRSLKDMKGLKSTFIVIHWLGVRIEVGITITYHPESTALAIVLTILPGLCGAPWPHS